VGIIQEFWFMFIHRKKENKEVSPAVSLTPNHIQGSVPVYAILTSLYMLRMIFFQFLTVQMLKTFTFVIALFPLNITRCEVLAPFASVVEEEAVGSSGERRRC